MKFIVLLLVFGMNRYWVGAHPLFRQDWMEDLYDWIADLDFVRNLDSELRMAVTIGVPVLITLLVFWLVRDWLFGLLWILGAVCVVGYSVDISRLGARLQQHLQWLKGVAEGERLEDAAGYHDRFTREMVQEEFVTIYPQVFWFFLLGPAGALLYRLAQYYSTRESRRGPADVVSGEELLQILEWIPARICSFGFAIVGDFAATVRGWAGALGDWRTPTEDYLAELAECAIDAAPDPGQDVTTFVLEREREIFDLRDLLDRTVVFWLVLFAVLVLLGWS